MKKTWTVVIVIVVLAIVGFGVFKVLHHMQAQQAAQQASQQAAAHPVMKTDNTMKAKPTEMSENSVYKAMSDPKLGTIMKDPKGMTLYIFANDTSSGSACSGACLKAWPAYVAAANTTNLPANITVIKRSDGTSQYAWKGKPLYYFEKDKDSGDAYGNGVGSVWTVVKL